MAIRVKAQNDILGEELNAKLGSLGLEIVVDEDTNLIQNPIEEEEEDSEKTKKDQQ